MELWEGDQRTGQGRVTKLYLQQHSRVGPCVQQTDNINPPAKAAGVEVEPFWPPLFAKLFETKSVGDLIANVGAGGSSLPSPPILSCPPLYSLPL